MADYRRNRVRGGAFFLTVNLFDRDLNLLAAQIDAPREVARHRCPPVHSPTSMLEPLQPYAGSVDPCREAMPPSLVGDARSSRSRG